MTKFKGSFDKRPVKDGIFPCDELLPGDGIDPRHDKKASGRKVANRKALQLCAQIKDGLNLALAGSGDDVLRNMSVLSVLPSPDSTQLLVSIESTDKDASSHIEKASGFLRTEAASCICRKRVPNLKFIIM